MGALDGLSVLIKNIRANIFTWPTIICGVDSNGDPQPFGISGGTSGGGGGGILITQSGAANLAISQVTSTGTAATLVGARATRRSVLIRNTDAANSVWVGPATVTTGNGFLIKAGESVPFTFVGIIQIIDNGSHAVVAVADEYD